MDTFIFDSSGCSIHNYKYSKASDTRPVIDAGTSECMVHPTCYGIYVLIFPFGMCIPDSGIRIVQIRERCIAGCRYLGIYRNGVSDFRYAFGSDMGKGGLGAFLELGSEGDLGSGDLALLSVIYALEIISKG